MQIDVLILIAVIVGGFAVIAWLVKRDNTLTGSDLANVLQENSRQLN